MHRIMALGVDVDFPADRRRERAEWLTSLAGEGWTVEARAIAHGPEYLESTVDQALALPAIVEAVAQAEREKFDAAIILCMTDPGLEACRELVDIPVVGTAQAACLVAMSLGGRFSIVTLSRAIEPLIERTARSTGVNPAGLASVRSIEMTIAEMAREPARVYSRLLEQSRAAVRQDGACSIVLGCTEMGAGMAARLSAELRVPVIDPNVAGLGLARLLVSAGLKQSRVWYPLTAGGWPATKARLKTKREDV